MWDDWRRRSRDCWMIRRCARSAPPTAAVSLRRNCVGVVSPDACTNSTQRRAAEKWMNKMPGQSKRVLVVGDAGDIGSHTLRALLRDGHAPIVLDKLSRANRAALEAIERAEGRTVPLAE